MRRRSSIFLIELVTRGMLFLCLPVVAFSEEKSNSGVESKTTKGLHFKVPSDWPIEERNGVVAPIPIEEYMSRKFGALDGRIRTLEQQVSAIELRLRVDEEKRKSPGATSGLRSTEAQP